MSRYASRAFVALALLTLSGYPAFAQTASRPAAGSDPQLFLKTYCQGCHQGGNPSGHLDLTTYATAAEAITKDPKSWDRVFTRVRDASMPPKGVPAPTLEERDTFATWGESTLRGVICAAGPVPGPAPLRRLNRNQYSNTVRDLLSIEFDAGRVLPEDGAGGEGFDNAAETLFLSPIHAEKYLESAKDALNFTFKDPRARGLILVSQSPRDVLAAFLPRAFRRPVAPDEIDRYLAIFNIARKRGENFDRSVQFALQAVLISPEFLFRIETPNPNPDARLLGDYELASRLSYFLWNSMPDQELFALAAKGALHDPETLRKQIVRMLDPGVRLKDTADDVRLIKNAKVEAFAQQFVEQWLGTRDLGRDIKPDAALFPQFYDAEIQSSIREEPIMFMKELLTSNLSILNFLDSKFGVMNATLNKFYGLNMKVGGYHERADLPANSHRGGLLGMAAVLSVSSYPDRTSPVLRGKWVLESIQGTPPPAPPQNVPALEAAHAGPLAKTMRERLSQHRKDPACASCHQRIDPLGFGLENYDVLGRWRTEDLGLPVDAKGELPDGTTFNGPDELKAVLLSRQDVFVRNLTNKMLGYALGRGLAIEDSCTVDAIIVKLKQNDYRAQTLVNEIVLSAPFRYQAGTPRPQEKTP